jgi:hypothetical protein
MMGAALAALILATPALAQELNLPRQKVELVAPPFVHPHEQATKQTPKIIEFRMEIEEKEVVIDEQGTKFQAMTFNGSMPGPLMVVHQGDYVELTLVNPETNTMPHNIDFHSATGPLMSIKAVNSLSHYTDWTIGHVHSGALGWVGYVSFGAIYCLVPWLWNRPLYSLKLVNWHFWISTIGIVLYITAMWVSGILQGLMWRAYTSLGFLEYSFIETVEAMHPFYVIRAMGGVLFLIGALLMVWNLWQTVNAKQTELAGTPALVPAE